MNELYARMQDMMEKETKADQAYDSRTKW